MSLHNYKGCLMECYKSLPIYYTKMCFKIPNFLGRKSVFLPSNLHYNISLLLVIFRQWIKLEIGNFEKIVFGNRFKSLASKKKV
jgi:hypothetical protein